MKVSPILFSIDRVKKLLDGTKTETRRLVPRPTTKTGGWVVRECRHQPYLYDKAYEWCYGNADIMPTLKIKSAYGGHGDYLYVRETWCEMDNHFFYRASTDGTIFKWHTSMHMPRAISRLTLLIESAVVERLQAQRSRFGNAVTKDYASRWDAHYKTPGDRWDDNPWVWVYGFKVIHQNIDEVIGRIACES